MPATKTARNIRTPKRSKQSRGATQFPGSCAYADSVPLDRTHVWRVLSGQRQSKRVVNGYRNFLLKQGITPPKNLGTPRASLN